MGCQLNSAILLLHYSVSIQERLQEPTSPYIRALETAGAQAALWLSVISFSLLHFTLEQLGVHVHAQVCTRV